LRLRSRPQPQRMTAGLAAAYLSPSAARIDHHEEGTASLRLLQQGHQMDTRDGRVGPPYDDHLRVNVVGERYPRHLAVHAYGRARGRCGANGTIQARAAETPEQAGIGGVLGQKTIRAAVGNGQNRLAAKIIP